MIKAKHHIAMYPMFKWLTRFMIKRNFKRVIIDREFNDNGNAVLVIANHISWWDGFWIMLLNLKVIKRRFHFMMLEEQLRKHWYFQYSGGYSVKKKSRNIIESVNYTSELLKNQQNMVLMFPQGHINSMHNPSVRFESGIDRIIQSIPPEVQVLFVVNLVDYFSDAKPKLFIYLKSFLAGNLKSEGVEAEYTKFFTQVTDIQKTKTT
jgi:1-acyl-sn-glycerol-3-phosphate acyltransferase